jgi:hypothetical protein
MAVGCTKKDMGERSKGDKGRGERIVIGEGIFLTLWRRIKERGKNDDRIAR